MINYTDNKSVKDINDFIKIYSNITIINIETIITNDITDYRLWYIDNTIIKQKK